MHISRSDVNRRPEAKRINEQVPFAPLHKKDEAQDQRVAMLEEAAALAEFLAEQMPALQKEWHKQRDVLRRNRSKETSKDVVQQEYCHAEKEVKKTMGVEEYILINGIHHYLFHSGTTDENPVLLFLHGGLAVLHPFLPTLFKTNGKNCLP